MSACACYNTAIPARKPAPADEKPQFERFIETARKIGAGKTDGQMDAVIRKIAASKISIGSAASSSHSVSKKGHS